MTALEKLKLFTSCLLSVALLALAAAILMFSLEVGKVRESTPVLLGEVEKILATTDIASWGEVVQSVTVQIPPLLAEIEAIRVDVVPPLMKEVQIANSTTIPAVLAESEAIREFTPTILSESEAIRGSIPPILNESQAIRESLPGIMDQANVLLDKSDQLAADLSRNAVKGGIKGVVETPFDFVRGAVDSVTERSESTPAIGAEGTTND